MYWSKNVVLQNSFLLVPNKFLVPTKIRSQTNVVYFGLKTIMGPTKCWVKQNIMSNIFLDFKKCGSINCIKKTWIQICRSEKWSPCTLSLWIWLRFTLYPVRCKNGSHNILWLWFTLYPVALDHPVCINYGSPCILVYGGGMQEGTCKSTKQSILSAPSISYWSIANIAALTLYGWV